MILFAVNSSRHLSEWVLLCTFKLNRDMSFREENVPNEQREYK